MAQQTETSTEARADVSADAWEPSEPTSQHQWLKKFEGEWSSYAKSPAMAGMPASKSRGTMSAKMLGGLWMVGSMSAEASGMPPFHSVITIGYDEQKQRYVGTWVDSVMNHMWQYNGRLAKSDSKLVLTAKGPNFLNDGKTTVFRDSYEFTSADHIVYRSEMKTEEGQWEPIMTGEMNRLKLATAE